MRELLDLLFKYCEFICFAFEDLLSGSKALNLVFFLLIGKVVKFLLVNVNKLVNIMEFFFYQLQLLLKIGSVPMRLGRHFDFIENFIDSLSEFVELVAIFLVLYFKGDNVSLVIFFRPPFLIEQVGWAL